MVEVKTCKCCLRITNHIYIGPDIILSRGSPQ